MVKPDIIKVVEKSGIQLIRKGRSFWAHCPFHEDKNPSFSVDSERQRWRCWSCNESGDVIAFVQKLEGLSFKEALRRLSLDNSQPIKITPREKTERDLLRAFRSWEREYYHYLAMWYRAFHDVKRTFRSIDDAAQFSELIHQMPVVEYHMDILCYGSDEEKYKLYNEVNVNGKF